jgi:hypothetical protein
MIARSTRSFSYCVSFVFIALVLAVSCSRDLYEATVKDLPRRFLANEKGYLLDEKRPGLIDDDFAVCTADAGARTNFHMTLTGMKKQFGVLEQAGLVTHRKGRARADLQARPAWAGQRGGMDREVPPALGRTL